MRNLDHQGGVVSYYNSVLPYLTREKNLKILRFHLGPKFRSNSLFHPVTDQIRFKQFLNKQEPDLVHVNPSLNFKSFIRDGLIIWQAKRKKIYVLVFFHGWDKPFENILIKKLKWFFDKTYLKADKFIVLASDFKRKLRQWGVQSEIILGTTTVDDSLLNNFDIRQKIRSLDNKNSIKILFLSRIEKEKGIFETIDAFQQLMFNGYNVNLSIAGDGSAFRDVVEYVKLKNIPENKIKFLGYISGDNKKNTFKEHDIFCLPSYEEGMPSAVLEAMSFGLPVITSPVGGLKDFFENNKMGFLAKDKNSNEVFDLLKKLISNKKLIKEISRYNYNFAKENFLASITSEKLIQVYRSMV